MAHESELSLSVNRYDNSTEDYRQLVCLKYQNQFHRLINSQSLIPSLPSAINLYSLLSSTFLYCSSFQLFQGNLKPEHLYDFLELGKEEISRKSVLYTGK